MNIREIDTFGLIYASVAFVCMVSGMVSHGLYNHFIGAEFWAWRNFAAALVVSPIVFASFLHIVKSEVDLLTGGLMSFQNGFFWNEIFQGASFVGAGT